MTNQEYIQHYLEYIKYEKRLSPLTVKNYHRDIELLLEILPQTTLGKLSIDNIRRSGGATKEQLTRMFNQLNNY